MSTSKVDPTDSESIACVSAEDEAFMCTLWQNCYAKWIYQDVQCRAGKPVDPDEEDSLAAFTDAKGGQKKYGGWKPEAIRYYEAKLKLIKKNREDQKEYITQVETEALMRIRTKHDCDVNEAKRKTRKRKASSLSEFDDVESEDEFDYTKW